MTNSNLNLWELENSRVTMFFASPVDYKNQTWWRDVTGMEPESTSTRMQTGEYVEDGVFGDYRLTMVVNIPQNRVDWISYPALVTIQQFPSVGKYIQHSRTLFEALKSWTSSISLPCVRLAFGFVLIKDNENNDSSYRSMQELLPMIKFDLDGWSEFEFRVNNKTKSVTLENTWLNVISKWNPIKIVRLEFTDPSKAQPEYYANRLELDLSSTAQNTQPLSVDQMFGLSKEFFELADEYADKGFNR